MAKKLQACNLIDCEQLRSEHNGLKVQICGWITSKRVLGKILFINLSDQQGITQIVVFDKIIISEISKLPINTPIKMTGRVRLRENQNRKITTGEIEIALESYELITDGTYKFDRFRNSENYTNYFLYLKKISELRSILSTQKMVEIPGELLQSQHRIKKPYIRDIAIFKRCLELSLVGIDRWVAFIDDVLYIQMSFASKEDMIDIINLLNKQVNPDCLLKWNFNDVERFSFFDGAFGEAFSFKVNNEKYGSGYAPFKDLNGFEKMKKILTSQKKYNINKYMNDVITQRVPPFVFFTVNIKEIIRDYLMGEVSLPLEEGDIYVKNVGDLETQIQELCEVDGNKLEEKIKLLENRDHLEIIQQLKARIIRTFSQDSFETIKPLLSTFNMTADDVETILDVFPLLKSNILSKTPEQFFQFIWSLLGNDNVRTLLSSKANIERLHVLREHKIISDYRQLTYLNSDTLSDINIIIENNSNKRTVDFFRFLITNRPNDFSTFLQTFLNSNGDLKEDCCLNALELGFSTPILFKQFCLNKEKYADIKQIISETSEIIFPNNIINYNVINDFFYCKILKAGMTTRPESDESVVAELINYLFKPVNMDFRRIIKYMELLEDRTKDIEKMGLNFDGADWNKDKKCYQNSNMALFPSKNIASFFAKSSAGICTAWDCNLFYKPNHFHLNLVDLSKNIVVGNVQCYVIQVKQKRVLLIRGINPANTYVNLGNAGKIVELALKSVIQIANCSNLDEVHLTESLGVWNADSGRIAIRAILEQFYLKLPLFEFGLSYPVFTFGNRTIAINKSYVLWRK